MDSLIFIDSILGVTYKELSYDVEVFTQSIQKPGLLQFYFKDTLPVPMSSFDFSKLWDTKREITLDTASLYLKEYLSKTFMHVDKFDDNGMYSFQLSQFNSVFCQFYKNGTLYEESLWQAGLIYGLYKRYYPNGNLKMTGNVEWGYNKRSEVYSYQSGMWYYFDKLGGLLKAKSRTKKIKSSFWK